MSGAVRVPKYAKAANYEEFSLLFHAWMELHLAPEEKASSTSTLYLEAAEGHSQFLLTVARLRKRSEITEAADKEKLEKLLELLDEEYLPNRTAALQDIDEEITLFRITVNSNDNLQNIFQRLKAIRKKTYFVFSVFLEHKSGDSGRQDM
eukprot:GHVR01005327.1.p2 GENE.GHVR01005327.1~~GHVR01005327.1.p2  ORF type:complete len:150 (+),score=13.28 GHVR01005327.1:319-768(+)